MKTVLMVIALIFTITFCFISPQAATWHITPEGAGDAPTIQAGINVASTGDTLLLADGTYAGNGNRDISVNKAVVLRSESGLPDNCVIDCGGSELEPHRGFMFTTVSGALVEGITITNGYAPSEMYHEIGMHHLGGGIFISFALVTISNCKIANNISEHYGGGVYCENSSSTFERCDFISNSAGFGGGGMFCCGWFALCSPNIVECTFSGNSSSGGGGISCDDADPTITSCLFSKNTAGNGGGIACGVTWVWSSPHSPIVIHCTFSGNSGGGIYCGDFCSPTLKNTIIAYSTSGGGVTCFEGSVPAISCSNIYGNAGGDWVGCIAGQLGIPYGNISVDPQFCDTLNGDYHLDVNSSCLKQGWDNLCGRPIGAYEEGCGEYTDVKDQEHKAYLTVGQPFPNPFNPLTSITYSIPEAAPVSIRIYDIHGHLVAELDNGYRSKGEHRVSWEGKDHNGDSVASGVYFCRLQIHGRVLTRKMMLVR
jgi:predicted outer membrane repeat protein